MRSVSSWPLRSTTANLNGAAVQSIDLRCDATGCRLGADGEAHIIRADVEAGNGFINEIDYVMFRPIFVP